MTHVSLFRRQAGCTPMTCVIKPNPAQHFSSGMIISTMISLSSYDTLTRYGGTARSGWLPPGARSRKELSIMAKLSQDIKPGDVGFRREIGLIGATWASETSIIGSGWLFGSYFAAVAIGGAAIIAWIIGGIAIIILALVHAELGGMYPVAGGTARFPHLAYGPGAGISFGFFSFLQAVTVAPIEAYAVIRYASYFWHSIYNPHTKNVTHWGFVLELVLMAIFTAVNFLAMRLLNPIFSGITWWKVAIPVLTIIILL